VKNVLNTQAKQIIVAVAIPFALFACVLFFDIIVFLIQAMGDCRLYSFTGILCPGCGGTRSAAALVRGDVITSLRFNPVVIFLCVLGGAFYLEFLLKIFKINKKIVPLNKISVYTTLFVFSAFYIARLFIPFLAPPA
jgi:hypothetical protein